MPNVRSKGQKAFSFWADEKLIRDVDLRRGHKDRSQFIREAIAEKLKRMGIAVPEKLVYAPPRAQIIKIFGYNHGGISQSMAAEAEAKYRTKKNRKKK